MNPVAKKGVPTQGLSEVRGGAMPMLGAPGHGVRKGKGKLVITHGGAEARSRSPSPDARTMGGMMYSELHGLKGAGWCDEFRAGFVGGAKPTGLPAYGNPDVLDTAGFDDKMTGAGNISQTGRFEGQGMSGCGPSVGAGMSGCGPSVGAGRKKRAPAGPNDGRRKRAEIVKRVMGEKGLSMVEASKYVKAHGLY